MNTEPQDAAEPPAPVTWRDITSAQNRNGNGGYDMPADIMAVPEVQTAARAVVDALDLFGLEVGIAKAERDAVSSEESAAVSRRIADDLRKVRERAQSTECDR